jgi:hypothetical protein
MHFEMSIAAPGDGRLNGGEGKPVFNLAIKMTDSSGMQQLVKNKDGGMSCQLIPYKSTSYVSATSVGRKFTDG